MVAIASSESLKMIAGLQSISSTCPVVLDQISWEREFYLAATRQ